VVQENVHSDPDHDTMSRIFTKKTELSKAGTGQKYNPPWAIIRSTLHHKGTYGMQLHFIRRPTGKPIFGMQKQADAGTWVYSHLHESILNPSLPKSTFRFTFI
jgi:hypothetical protein